jgi:hypothetical protein
MKKIYSFLFAFTLIALLPLRAFALVDITLNDNSTTDIQSVSITIDTDTDTLEGVTIPIEYSEGITITEVNSGTIACSSLDYAEGTNTVTVTCELDEATALEGVLANILFTSEDETYTFTVLEDTTLDIGELEVGEIVNIGETTTEEETTVVEETDPLETEEPALVATQETSTEETGFTLDNLTDYLPYILIAGSVVLLISIIGILLSRKKETSEISEAPVVEETPPVTGTEPTLKDMVNKTEVASQQPQVVETAQSVTPPMPPVTEPPVVQSTPQPPVAETPAVPEMAQPTPVMPGTETEEQDSQELMQQESPSIQPETTVPPSAPETVIPETETPASVEDLQNSINNEIQNLASETPTAPTMPPVQPVEEAPSADELPPVPPTM